jgi:hypothetical protein
MKNEKPFHPSSFDLRVGIYLSIVDFSTIVLEWTILFVSLSPLGDAVQEFAEAVAAETR